jgi:Leucine-rich repeat (LRR) protein
VTPGTETVLIGRPAVFAIDIYVVSSTGYYAVQDDLGVITIYNNVQATLNYARLFCNVWPCFSANDAYNYGHILELWAAGIQGIQGSLDVTSLTQLTLLNTNSNQITDVNATGLTLLTQVDVSGGLLGTNEVNALLIALDNGGALAGSVATNNNTAPPSGGGITAANNLLGKGWFVLTD